MESLNKQKGSQDKASKTSPQMEEDVFTVQMCKCKKNEESVLDPSYAPSIVRKHILSFNPKNELENLEYKCMEPERLKCKAFWTFVDATPELQTLIQNGRFFYSSKPAGLVIKPEKVLAKNAQSVYKDFKDPGIILVPPMPMENKFRIESIRKTFEQQKEANKSNEEKFGIPRMFPKKEEFPDPKAFCAKYWGNRNAAAQLKMEMDEYDEGKWLTVNTDAMYDYMEEIGEE